MYIYNKSGFHDFWGGIFIIHQFNMINNINIFFMSSFNDFIMNSLEFHFLS